MQPAGRVSHVAGNSPGIRPTLPSTRPDPVRGIPPDLARSLGAHGAALLDLGHAAEAAQAFGEGLQALLPFLRAYPQAFGGLAKYLLENYLRAWRERPEGPRFLLILGEAGIGKSAFAAHLWLDQPMCAAAHFCIAGRGGTIEPLNFVESLSEQLEQRLPGFAEAKRQVLEREMSGVKIESTVEKRLRDTTNLDCG